ncbi:MAG: CoA-binding protein [Burkholderiales bacterium]|nr:CoA-binding protein [Burkholderiales bacterium]
MNPLPADVARILSQSRTIAVVGLSANAARTSHQVSSYMQKHGYRIIPINPTYSDSQILGETCYPDLPSAAIALAENGQKIEVVNCFRRAEDIPPIAKQAIQIGSRALWMQLGISHPESAQEAQAAGLQVVMNRCIKIDHMHWRAQQRLVPGRGTK